ncbi:MAG: hypothetical protein HY691_09545 [Chloroflexi bacterium]|nr:hypothetical protein [Chloroflexota bacterium]
MPHVVEAQYGLPRDALLRETAQCSGFERTGALIADAIGDVVDALIAQGELRQSGPQLALP